MKRQSARLMCAAMSVTARRSSGGVVGDEGELWVCLQAGTVGAFGIELGVVRGFFGRLEHRLVTSSEVMRLILYIVPVCVLFVIVLFENIQNDRSRLTRKSPRVKSWDGPQLDGARAVRRTAGRTARPVVFAEERFPRAVHGRDPLSQQSGGGQAVENAVPDQSTDAVKPRRKPRNRIGLGAAAARRRHRC